MRPIFLAGLAVLLAHSCAWMEAQSTDWRTQTRDALESEYTLTKVTADRNDIVTEGAVLVLKKDNLLMVPASAPNLAPNTYKDGRIAQGLVGSIVRVPGVARSKTFKTGDLLWATKIDVNESGVVFDLVSAPIDGMRYKSSLRLPFLKGSQPTSDQMRQIVSEVLDTQENGDSGESHRPSPAATEAHQAEATRAQTSGPPVVADRIDVAALDVAGVRLGMTPEEAIAALRTFDSWPVLNKRFSSDDQSPRGLWGSDKEGRIGSGFTAACEGAKDPIRYMVAIIAAKGPRINEVTRGPWGHTERIKSPAPAECAWSGEPSTAAPGEDLSEVIVYVSPTPGSERVIAVSLWKRFRNRPPVASVVESAQRKYPRDFTATTPPGDLYLERNWRFDARGRVVSRNVAEQLHLLESKTNSLAVGLAGSPEGFLPRGISASEGVGINLCVKGTLENHAIADEFMLTLFNASDLAKSPDQARSYYKTMHDKLQKEEVDKAKNGTSPIKM